MIDLRTVDGGQRWCSARGGARCLPVDDVVDPIGHRFDLIRWRRRDVKRVQKPGSICLLVLCRLE